MTVTATLVPILVRTVAATNKLDSHKEIDIMANTTSNDFSLAGIMQSATSAFDKIQSSVATLESLSVQGNTVADAMAAAISQSTDANGDTALSLQTRKLAELQTQKNKADLQVAIGMDGEGNARLSNKLAAKFQETALAEMDQAQSIRERESVGLLDNPLAYLFNQIILPDERNKLAAIQGEKAAVQNSMQTLNSFMQQTARTEAEFAQTMTAASVDSQVAGMEAGLQARALKARMDAINFNAHNVREVIGATQQQIDFQAKVAQIRNSEEHMQLAREAASRERVKFNKWLEDEKDTDAAIAQVTQYANATARAMGRPEFSSKQVELAMKGKSGVPGLVEQIKAFAQTGYVNENSGAIGARYGENFSSSMEFAQNVKTRVPEVVSSIGQQAWAVVKSKVDAGLLPKNDKKAVESALNAEVDALAKKWNKEIDAKDGRNPFNAPALPVLLQQKEVANSTLGKILSVQVAAGGLKEAAPDVVFEKGLEAFRSGQISLPELAANIRTLYSSAALYNNQQNQIERFGIPGQVGYNAKLNIPGVVIGPQGAYRTLNIFGPKQENTYNLTDLSAVNRALIKKLAASGINAFNDSQAEYKSVLSIPQEGVR